MNPPKPDQKINRLCAVVVQAQDADYIVEVLVKLGFSITRLHSTGGFLGRQNTTLLIGLSSGQEETLVRTLDQSCRTRVEYVLLPLEGSPVPLSTPTPITVGGATIFVVEVERFEEF